MPDTHINAYFAVVDEAWKEVQAAQAKYEAAKTALEAKKKEVGYVEPTVSQQEQVVPVVDDEPKKNKK